jgi:outer membrane protein TolC
MEKEKYSQIERNEHFCLPDACNLLTIEMAQEIARKNNPDYEATRHSMAAAEARFHQSLSAYLPTVTATYNAYEYKDTPMDQGGLGTDSRRYTKKQDTLTVRWLIFDGLVRTMDMLAAKHEKSKEEELNKDALRLLMKSVGIAYNNAILAKEKMRIAKADEIFNRQLFDDTKLKREAGASSLSDLLNFEVRMNSASSELLAEEFDFFLSRSILSELMGFSTGFIPEHVFPKFDKSTEMQIVDVEVLLDTAIVNRQDLKAYKHALESVKYKVWARWGAFLPTINAEANFGHDRKDWDSSGRGHFSPRAQNQSFNYGVEAEWVIFNGGKRWFQLREAQAKVAQNDKKLHEKWISVVAEVRQSHADLIRRIRQAEIFEKNLELVKKTRDLVEEEFKAGACSITRLNEAQRDLVVADTNFSTSVINARNAMLSLKAATGKTD